MNQLQNDLKDKALLLFRSLRSSYPLTEKEVNEVEDLILKASSEELGKIIKVLERRKRIVK